MQCLLAGLFTVAFLHVTAPAARAATTNQTIRIMAANLTSSSQKYDTPGLNILKGLKPDVVAIQEFKYANNTAADFRSMLDATFGTNFVYYRESGYNIPNGIISRFPILSSGSWDDTLVDDRGFAWAQLDLPGSNDLYVVSVHLYSSGSASDRNTEATRIKSNIQANFPANAWVVVAGDCNTDSRSEAAIGTFSTFLSDSPIPSDAVSGGDENTNEPRNKPYDYVLPSLSFVTNLVPAVFPSHTFTKGLVFDSSVYSPLSDVSPVVSGDSHSSGMQHMAVVKDFRITYSTTNGSPDAPAIGAQPQSQTVEPGSNATFTVTATGAATLRYQWRFGATSLAGATTSVLTITNAQSTNAGTYAVVVTNASGSITSSPAILSVGSAPVITAQPQGQGVMVGATAIFNVASTGTAPLGYQWRRNGSALAAATDSTLTLTNVQTTNAGSYSVVVTNAFGTATSSNALLTVNAPPAITSQPQGLTAVVGQDALFAVAATGAAPLSYQWRFNGTNITGATSTSYTRANVQTNDAGSYSVVITNTVGSLTSAPAVLVVSALTGTTIAQWNFNSVPPDASTSTGTTNPSVGTGTLLTVGGVTPVFYSGGGADSTSSDNSAFGTYNYPAVGANNKTAGVQFNVSTAGRQNIIIRWDHRPSDAGSKYARLRYTTNGSSFIDFPTAVSVNAGGVFEAKTNSLAGLPGVDDNPLFAFQIVSEFQYTATGAGGSNYVPATSSSTYGASGTMRFDLVTISGSTIAVATPPNIVQQPAECATSQAASATFDVMATGTAPLTYQWHLNSAPISGATGSTFVITNVQPADAGSYSVVVSNSAGSAISSNAALTLLVPAPTLLMASPQVLQWQGLSNLAYSVQGKTNAEDNAWDPLGTASSPGAMIRFTNQADAPQRFYRVIYP